MERLFRTTMLGLETGLRVGQIAQFNVMTCAPDQNAGDVLANPALADFDQIPVRHRSRVVGVLERGRLLAGTVRESMRLLDDSVLVSSDEPLTKFVPLLKKSSYRLVLVGTEIKGIVTRSDIGKAPVRLLAFTLVSHLETAMTELIRRHCPDDQSLFASVGDQRQKKRKRAGCTVLTKLEI
jgi:predicted transcriptional regulator